MSMTSTHDIRLCTVCGDLPFAGRLLCPTCDARAEEVERALMVESALRELSDRLAQQFQNRPATASTLEEVKNVTRAALAEWHLPVKLVGQVLIEMAYGDTVTLELK